MKEFFSKLKINKKDRFGNFLLRLKKLFTPLMLVSAMGALVTFAAYALFGKSTSAFAGWIFMMVMYFCLLLLGIVGVYLLTDHYRGNDLPEFAQDPDFVFLRDLDKPVLICDESGKITYVNRVFYKQSGGIEAVGQDTTLFFSRQPDRLCKREDGKEKDAVEVMLGDRSYLIKGHKIKMYNGTEQYVIIWDDRTELKRLQEKYDAEQSVIMYVVIDSLDEILRFAEGNYRTVASKIDEHMQKWADDHGAIVREYDRNKYQIVLHASALKEIIADKFAILDIIREVRVGESNIPVTVSIGVGDIRGDLKERSAASISALEYALQRGGDQAVVKTEKGMDVYGGKTKTVQNKTKVRARVVAAQLLDQICSSENVLIMAHRFADFDAFGACVGLAHFCKISGVKFNIVSNLNDPNLQQCFKKAMLVPDITADTFIDAATAQDMLRSETLLIIADVNNPEQFESKELAENADRIVFIDHHRKTGSLPTQPKITYIEPSASSTCELVADMLEQCLAPGALSKDEAELMLAGIVLDTKKYEINTGTKTFGAAQYLKGEEADPTAVQMMFADKFEDYKKEVGFGDQVHVYKGIYGIALNEHTDDDPAYRIAAAKAADKFLTVKGIEATFAVCRIGDSVRISGRSNGKINVQLILEKLGGGGRFDAAAVEQKESDVAVVLTALRGAIDEYEKELLAKPAEQEDKQKGEKQ